MKPDPNAARNALRAELYDRVARGDIGIVEALKTMRKIAGRTQIEYARDVGVSPRVLIELERGIGNPTMKTLAKLFAPFGLELGLRRRSRDGPSARPESYYHPARCAPDKPSSP